MNFKKRNVQIANEISEIEINLEMSDMDIAFKLKDVALEYNCDIASWPRNRGIYYADGSQVGRYKETYNIFKEKTEVEAIFKIFKWLADKGSFIKERRVD